jgi:hypothetical protein
MANPAMTQQTAAALRPSGHIQPQQTGVYTQQQQQNVNPASSLDPDQKKLQDIVDALTFIGNIREDINIILDNVGKSNASNNFSSVFASKASLKHSGGDSNLLENNKSHHNGQDQNENDQTINNDLFERFLNMDLKQQQFLEKTDTKYLQDRIVDFNKNLT